MLKKRDRLTARDILTLDQGKSVFGTLVSLRFRIMSRKKISVSVSKKISARAIDRSRIRRRVYGALDHSYGKVTRPIFGLIMPKKECATAEFKDICKDIESVFAKAGLFS
jgi:ribonuclease P protein component